MKQFKGLMQKEWSIYKKQFMVPVWIMIGIYALLIIGIIVGLVKDGKIIQGEFDRMIVSEANVWIYFLNTVIALGPMAIMILFSSSIIINMLNEDFKSKCAIFHLAQPVSLVKMLGAKLLLVIIATLSISAALALFNAIVFNIGFAVVQPVNVYYGFLGYFQTMLVTIFPAIYLITMSMMFASFTIKRPQIFIPIIIGIEGAIKFINALTILEIPSLSVALFTLAFSKLSVNVFDGQKLKYQMGSNGEFDILKQSIQEMWLNLFDMVNVYRILLSVAFIVIAYFMYKRRDVA